MANPMNWQEIAHRDPYLAGSIAARGYEWWDEATAEQEAESAGLTGESRSKFLAGWHAELTEREQERKEERFRDADEMSKGHEKGDPEAR